MPDLGPPSPYHLSPGPIRQRSSDGRHSPYERSRSLSPANFPAYSSDTPPSPSSSSSSQVIPIILSQRHELGLSPGSGGANTLGVPPQPWQRHKSDSNLFQSLHSPPSPGAVTTAIHRCPLTPPLSVRSCQANGLEVARPTLLLQRDYLQPPRPPHQDHASCPKVPPLRDSLCPPSQENQVIHSPQRWRKAVSLPNTSRPLFTAEHRPPPRKFSEENSPTIVVTDCDGGTEEEDSGSSGHHRPLHAAAGEEFARYRMALRSESPLGSMENMRRISESSSYEGWDPPAGSSWEEVGGSPPDNLAAFFSRDSLEQAGDQPSGLEQSFQGFQIEDLGHKAPSILGLESYHSPSLQSEFFSVSSMDSATLTDLDELMKSELQKL